MTEQNKRVLQRAIEEVFNGQKYEVAAELYDADCAMINPVAGLDGNAKGPDYVIGACKVLREAFPDLHYEITELFGEGDKVALRWRAKGTHLGPFGGQPPTGQKIDVTAFATCDFKDGKLIRIMQQVDEQALASQLSVERPLEQYVKNFFDDVWGDLSDSKIFEKKEESIRRLVHPECIIHGIPSMTAHGVEPFIAFHQLIRGAFRSIKVEVLETMEDQERISMRCDMHYESRDGCKGSLTGGGLVRIKAGKITEAWNQWDFLRMLTHLDMATEIQESTFAQTMQKIAQATR